MRRWTPRRLHRWLALYGGVFMLIWLVSGVFLILPNPAPAQGPRITDLAFDMRSVQLSPADLAAGIEGPNGGRPAVRSLTLRRLGARVVYEIRLMDGEARLIDAYSGKSVWIDAKVAEDVARARAGTKAAASEIQYLEDRSLSALWGPRPAYLVEFADRSGVSYYVSASDGALERLDTWSRVVGIFARIHTFEPVRLVTRSDGIRRALIALVGILGIAAACSGFYLTVSRP